MTFGATEAYKRIVPIRHFTLPMRSPFRAPYSVALQYGERERPGSWSTRILEFGDTQGHPSEVIGEAPQVQRLADLSSHTKLNRLPSGPTSRRADGG